MICYLSVHCFHYKINFMDCNVLVLYGILKYLIGTYFLNSILTWMSGNTHSHFLFHLTYFPHLLYFVWVCGNIWLLVQYVSKKTALTIFDYYLFIFILRSNRRNYVPKKYFDEEWNLWWDLFYQKKAFFNNVTFHEGDIFLAPRSFALAHCVSSDLKMSRGIAATFK